MSENALIEAVEELTLEKIVEKVESFVLNHNYDTAPYVRKAKIISVNEKYSDCVVSKFDGNCSGAASIGENAEMGKADSRSYSNGVR